MIRIELQDREKHSTAVGVGDLCVWRAGSVSLYLPTNPDFHK